MLVTVDDAKTYLGINGSDYDDFLAQQCTIISDVVEEYCGRKFAAANYVQTFYKEDYDPGTNFLSLFHYPVNTLTSVLDGTTNITSSIRLHKPSGQMTLKDTEFFSYGDSVVVTYNAGYATIPSAIQSVIFSLLGEVYNKRKSGVALSFGSDVQSISIPGTISVAFDYSLQSNDRTSKFGTILGNYVNSLDPYRSERVVTGSGTIQYVS